MTEDIEFTEHMPNYAEEGKETIKLIKNSRGYNWEIKVKGDLLGDDELNRLELIEKKLNDKYGGAV